MNLTKDAKKCLYEAYGNMAEELFIMHVCLRNEGFSREESMQIILTCISVPDRVKPFKDKKLRTDILRDYINSKNKEKE